MYVEDYMQAIIMTVSPHDLLSTAHRLMNELFIRHLPVVVGENRLVGILTDRDIRQAVPDGLHEMTVNNVMTRQVYTVSPDTPLLQAASTLLEQKFDCLPVVDDDGILTGLITVSDFVRVYVEQNEDVLF